MKFSKVRSAKVSSMQASIYEVAVDTDPDSLILQERLVEKIRKMKIHNEVLDDSFADYLPPNASQNLINMVNEVARSIADPAKSKIPAFDVRRSRVTEFMSQVLLEDQYACVFHEVIDKRINLQYHERDKHVQGIDVTGIQNNGAAFKFVVCEVKASSDKSIPSSVSQKVFDEIKDAYNDKGNRLTKEILDALRSFGSDTSITSSELTNIITFLGSILQSKQSKKVITGNIVFFPFLVRFNSNINRDGIKEFDPFNSHKFQDTEVQGVIWSFNKNIDEFCSYIYEQALNE